VTQTDLNARISRRFAMKGAGVLAAARALPAAAVVAHAADEPEVVHTMGCFHRVWARPADREELDRLQAAFDATGPSEEQRRLNTRIQDALGEVFDEEYDRFIAERARHLPAAGPAIRLLAFHVIEAKLDDVGACCEDGATWPA
jgi:hypothetical protein